MSSNLKVTKGGIAAPFVANHDTGRLLGAVAGKTDRSAAKFGNALLQMMNGCTFSYYGDEAGMSVVNPPSGTAKDEDKRQPMPWGDSYQCKPVSNSTSATDEQKYCYGTVKSQLEDPDSCVNFMKDVNALRNSNPEIARGSVTKVFASELDDFCVIKKTWENKSVYLLINASSNSTTNYDISSLGEGKVVGSLCASDTYDKTSLVKKGLIKTAPRSIVAVR
jgi:glycosidase